MSKYGVQKIRRVVRAGHARFGHWLVLYRAGTSNSRYDLTDGSSAYDKSKKPLMPNAYMGLAHSLEMRSWNCSTQSVRFPATICDDSGCWFTIANQTADPVASTRTGPAPTRGYSGRSGRSRYTPSRSSTPSFSSGSSISPQDVTAGGNNTIPQIFPKFAPTLFRLIPQNLSRMIWGPPGCGKSDLVQQFTDDIEGELFDIRLGQYDPQELKGILLPDPVRKSAYSLRPDFFPPEDFDKPCVIFFDEISSAVPAVQAAAYQVFLNRRAGMHKLPEQAYLFAAGNRENDRGVVYKMPSPLANRMFHMEIKPDIVSWRAWALTAEVDSRVISFLIKRPEFLFKLDRENSDKAWPSPRSWDFCSQSIRDPGVHSSVIPVIAAGWVGSAAAREFQRFLSSYPDLPIEEILDGRLTTFAYAATNALSTPDGQSILSVALVANSEEDIHLSRILKISVAFSPEPHMMILRLLLEKYGVEKMRTVPEFARDTFASRAITEHLK